MNPLPNLIHLLQKYSSSFAPVVPYALNRSNLLVFDLTENNEELKRIDIDNTPLFTEYIFNKMAMAGTQVAIGRYNEERIIYRKRATFAGEEPRSIHLGVDLWAAAGTPVYCALEGKVHSFQNNKGFGDYGPTVIVEHCLEGVTFFTLYGHLSAASFTLVSKGKYLQKGEKLGDIGNYPQNGDWPPHLHFQIITDLQGREGDFPGVAAPSQREMYLKLCPDPGTMLGLPVYK